jgi:diguanylate cyclase (GGDEF)-like protein/PAS domain S-box-containing protein
MFDADSRLVLCNRRYLELYNLTSGEVKPGITLLQVLELRKAKGTFPLDPRTYVTELEAQLATGKRTIMNTELADGRFILVENQPMSDGRWVSTHEDITEQKQAERQLREQKLQLDTALNNMTQGLNLFDASGRLVVCNERYLQMYGLSPDIVRPGCTIEELVQARIASGSFFTVNPEQYTADLRAAIRKREPTSSTMELTDGRTIAVISQPTPDGTGWVVTHEDITERRRAEKERDRSQAFATTVIENVPSTIVVKDAHDGRYVLINRAGEAYFGVPREAMIGKRAEEVFAKDEAEMIAKHDQESMNSGQPQFYDERPVTTPAGHRRIVTTTRLPIRDSRGVPQYLLSLIDDRTHRKRAEAQIARLVHHDLLTGIPNRAAFTACIEATVDAASKDANSFALMSLDFDRFKEVNDVFGHTAGDELLIQLSKRLQAAVGGAFLARLGGDEFVVIATDGIQPSAAEVLADRLLAAVDEDIIINGKPMHVGVSIGIAIFPTDGSDAATLIANADAALFRAKTDGGGSFRFFEANMDRRLRERRVMQQELRSAIERGELAIYYQPQAHITGKVIGFEALARWHHPDRGIISPSTFIPLAEDSGLIASMGEWIMREACRQAAGWPNPLQIAINLSPVQFRHGDLPGLVHGVLLETGLSPSRLELEVTEGVLIDDFSRAVSILRRLKALGVRIAMDDFGTGYSSLSYLQSFPFDKIKIDQAFISNLERNPQSATIIRAVIGLARGLELPVVAEGVETQEQLAFLSKEACDEIQGFLVGQPLPIEQYAHLTGKKPTRPKRKTRVGTAAS